MGLAKPPLTPQTVGRWFETVVGDWESTTDQEMPKAVVSNLLKLQEASESERVQLGAEIRLHWHALSPGEKHTTLLSIADRFPVGSRPGMPDEVLKWLGATFATTPDTAGLPNLLAALTPAARDALAPALRPSVAVRHAMEAYMQRNETCIDFQYDYAGFLAANPVIGEYPPEAKNRKIAIIGGGYTGMTAAWELDKAGADVHVIEALDRLGGKAYTRRFELEDGTPSKSIAEMGPMRYPPSGKVHMHYVNVLGVKTDPEFPNPGVAPTKLLRAGEVINFPAGGEPESERLGMNALEFKKMMNDLLKPIRDARTANDTAGMRKGFQDIIGQFEHSTYREMMLELSRRYGFDWVDYQAEDHGYMGIGTGGFGAFFDNGAVQLARVMIDELEKDQVSLVAGSQDMVERFASTPHLQPDGSMMSLNDKNCVRLNTEMLGIEPEGDKVSVTLKGADGSVKPEEFDFVICAVPLAELSMAGVTSRAAGSAPLVNAEVADAIKGRHYLALSKTFMHTESDFWNEPGNETMAQTILTDELSQGTYSLKHPDSPSGTVLMAYQWEEEARKAATMDDEKKVRVYTNSIGLAEPRYVENLKPKVDVERSVRSIDWADEPFGGGGVAWDQAGRSADMVALRGQFQSVLPDNDQPNSRVVFAGEGISQTAGWSDQPMATGVEAACAGLYATGATVRPNSPLEMEVRLYDYNVKK